MLQPIAFAIWMRCRQVLGGNAGGVHLAGDHLERLAVEEKLGLAQREPVRGPGVHRCALPHGRRTEQHQDREQCRGLSHGHRE